MKKVSKEYQEIIDDLDAIRKNTPDLKEEDKETLEEAADIIADYETAVSMHADMMQRFLTKEQPTKKAADLFLCPNCGQKQMGRNMHCPNCGKAIEWDRRRWEKK